jgi:multiple sugar transport system ATP-binding protein/lactose/L-arabinose transport system ATP-binding protein
MRLQIAKLHQDLQNTMIYVTHDQVEAMTLADKIVVLRDGRVEQVGSPLELYHNPQNEFVAGFIGSPKMNFLPCVVGSCSEAHAQLTINGNSQITIPLPDKKLAEGQQLTLGIRPEHLEIDGGSDITIEFQSEVVERLGNSTYMFGQSCGIDGFKVHLPGDQEVSRYQSLELSFSEKDCHLFDAQGQRID